MTWAKRDRECMILGSVAQAAAALEKARIVHAQGVIAGCMAYTYKQHVDEAAEHLNRAQDLLVEDER